MNPDNPTNTNQPDSYQASAQPNMTPTKNHLPRLLLIVVAVLVLLLLIAVYALSNNHKPKNATANKAASTAQTASINITSNGFEPAYVQVKPGTDVTWTNTDSSPHQVAADPYPKDDSIPDFHSGIVLNKDDTISFTFTKAGAYTYHDEKNPLVVKGTIEVLTK